MTLVSTAARGGGGLPLLGSQVIGVGGGTFDIANIDQTYNDLLIVCIARGTRVAVNDTLLLRFNNDSAAANYEGERVSGNLAAAAAATQNAAANSGLFLNLSMPAASSTANVFGVTECWVHGYSSTAWLKNALIFNWGNYNGATAREVDINGGQWSSTNAINRVQALGNTTANLAAGSTLRIYGRL